MHWHDSLNVCMCANVFVPKTNKKPLSSDICCVSVFPSVGMSSIFPVVLRSVVILFPCPEVLLLINLPVANDFSLHNSFLSVFSEMDWMILNVKINVKCI